MARPRKGTEEVFYDTFADWDAEDQRAALKVLEQIHRMTTRAAKRGGNPNGQSAAELFDQAAEITLREAAK